MELPYYSIPVRLHSHDILCEQRPLEFCSANSPEQKSSANLMLRRNCVKDGIEPVSEKSGGRILQAEETASLKILRLERSQRLRAWSLETYSPGIRFQS